MDFPPDWTVTTLGEAMRWRSGGTPRRSNPTYFDGEIPWAIIGDLNDGVVTTTATKITEDGYQNSAATWVQPNSILIALYGSIGKLGIAEIPLTTNQAIAFALPPDTISHKFLFWYLRFARSELISRGKGGTQRNISLEVLKAFPFAFPPRPQQDILVDAIEQQLTRIDAAQADLQSAAILIRQHRASILKAAVQGRLVPTEAELARRENKAFDTGEMLVQRLLSIRRNIAPGSATYREPAPPDTADTFRLADGWGWATAEQLSDPRRSITYGVIKLGKTTPEGVHTLRSSDVRSLAIHLENVKTISRSIANNYQRTFLRGGEVVVTVRGTLGGVAVVPQSCAGFNISREVAMIAPIEDAMAQTISHFIAAPPLQRWLMTRTKGIAYTGINIETLKRLPIPVPPLQEQIRISAEIERRLSALQHLESSVSTNLKRSGVLRHRILSAAFSGRLVSTKLRTVTTQAFESVGEAS
jgi:type I restriction enzyme, S subunit